jgi:hypothetical protein
MLEKNQCESNLSVTIRLLIGCAKYYPIYSDINSFIASQKAHRERINADESSTIHSNFNMFCSSFAL